ncbi:unnamed protein product [Cuscuta epithymum]|uniref:t-SNARE coiled-coil homology domain-containing protein n=1 Tax=Cuscuta epithymum TaxID=186058 RepID=A0AAV0CRG1_9ASTE|nr:unnamed protein product [Cuscuta epithymum]CAH9136287.1 unnamed protein product [Cuscuta epithymum]
MSYRRDHRTARSALFDKYDSIEEGGIRATRSYSHDIDEHDNDKAVDKLQDRVSFLKKLTGDIHEEVESHNRVLDKMGNEMDSSRGIMSRTMDRFKMVSHVFYAQLKEELPNLLYLSSNFAYEDRSTVLQAIGRFNQIHEV